MIPAVFEIEKTSGTVKASKVMKVILLGDESAIGRTKGDPRI